MGISVFCVLTVMLFVETLLLLLLSQQGIVDQRLGSRSIEEEMEEALGAVGMTHVPSTPPLLLRQRGLIAMERLTGMLLVAVAVQMLLSGVADYMRR
jgi:hypothetical protein